MAGHHTCNLHVRASGSRNRARGFSTLNGRLTGFRSEWGRVTSDLTLAMNVWSTWQGQSGCAAEEHQAKKPNIDDCVWLKVRIVLLSLQFISRNTLDTLKHYQKVADDICLNLHNETVAGFPDVPQWTAGAFG